MAKISTLPKPASIAASDRVAGLKDGQTVQFEAAQIAGLAMNGVTTTFPSVAGMTKRVAVVGDSGGFTFAPDEDGQGIDISCAAGSTRICALNLLRSRPADDARFILTCTLHARTSTASFGLAFGGAGAACRHYHWGENGSLIRWLDDATAQVLAGAGVLPGFVVTDTVAMSVRANADGDAVIGLIKNGVQVGEFAVSDVPEGPIEATFRGQTTWTIESLYTDGYPGIVRGEIDRLDGALQKVDSRVSAVASTEQVEMMFATSKLLSFFERRAPAGWAGAPVDYTIYRGAEGLFFTSASPDARRPFTVEEADSVFFVDPAAGSDANDGDEETPFAGLYKATHGRTGKVWVYAKPGLYDRLHAFNDCAPQTTALVVVPWGDGRIVSSMHHPDLVWSPTAGKANTWEAVIVSVGSVVDAADIRIDPDGAADVDGGEDYGRLALVASVDAVEATPGSYFVSGTTVYVHTFDGRQPDADVRVYENKRNFHAGAFSNGPVVWMENVDFEGGGPCARISAAGGLANNAVFKGCTFKYSAAGYDALRIDGKCDVKSFNCVAAHAGYDGFNYHYHASNPAGPPTALEVGCVARRNGHGTNGTNNGSTMHDGGTIRRSGGRYVDNQNRDLHDIDAGFSWNLGCRIGGAPVAVAAGTGAGDETKIWLDECTIAGSPIALDTTLNGSDVAQIYVNGGSITGAQNGNVSAYSA